MIIAVDTCVLVDFQIGNFNKKTEILEQKLSVNAVFLPPVVLTEFLSNPRLDHKTYRFFQDLPTLEIEDGYWQRAGITRRKLLQNGLKSKLGDSLIVQSCIDHEVALLTRDEDFNNYVKYCALRLV